VLNGPYATAETLAQLTTARLYSLYRSTHRLH